MEIAIASKARPSFTSKKLVPEFTLFVEPKDFDSYQRVHAGKIVNIGVNDRGFSFVRNYMMQYFSNGRVAFLDDDIKKFLRKDTTGKLVECDFSDVCAFAESLMDKGFDFVSLSPNSPGIFFSETDYVINKSKFGNVIFLNLDYVFKNGLSFDEKIIHGEDTDFSMGVILSGGKFASVKKFCFVCPEMDSIPGGCCGIRTPERMLQNSEYLRSKWGDVFTYRDERLLNYRVNWRKFHAMRNSKLQ